MKRIFIVVIAVLLAMSISTSAFAHSHFGGSNPADGDVITEPLNEVVLNFDGQIEQGSFIDVTTSEGQAIEIQETIIGDGTLTGTFADALPNGEYQVDWSIISADGHPLEGEFSFTVNAEVPESEKEVTEEPSETMESTKSEEINETNDQSTEENEPLTSVNETEKESSSMTVILIVLFVIVIIGGFFLFTKRKK